MTKILSTGRSQPLVNNVNVVSTVELKCITATLQDISSLTARIDCIQEDTGDFAIASFNVATTPVEVGASVVNPAFTASYTDGPPVQALLDDDEGSPQKDVSGTPTAFSSDGTFQKTTNNDSVIFTLSAKKFLPLPAEQANVTLQWQPRVFWGVGPDGLSTEADIEGLANSALDNNRNRVFSVSPGAGEHAYFAAPTAYGTPTFQVGPFPGGFILEAAAVSVTNVNGVTQTYDLWKSVNPNLGPITVTVT